MHIDAVQCFVVSTFHQLVSAALTHGVTESSEVCVLGMASLEASPSWGEGKEMEGNGRNLW